MSEARDSMERELEVVKLELDQDGSPVSIEPRGWFVCIVPGLVKQWWHPFVHQRHKHVFAMRPAGPGQWTLFEPWWHRLLAATITSEQARKFLIWGARGDVLHVREAVPGRGSQVRGWMTCATLASYLLGRNYWVWTPHGLYKLLLREPGVCRVDVSALLRLDEAQLADASLVIAACEECTPGAPQAAARGAEAVLHELRPRPRARLGATGRAAAGHSIWRRRQALNPSRRARNRCPTPRAWEHSC